MPKLFECCRKCKPPKRASGCHGTCPEYLADRAELDRLNVIDRNRRVANQYVKELVEKSMDIEAKQRKNAPRNRRGDRT